MLHADLGEPDKPAGVFLLVGPSGVGKTETAATLADLLYGGTRSMITINMSEYQEAHSVSGLKGAPPGYVGFGQGGVLTEAVRRAPYSVVLLDEVEKGHPDIMELFYQVFDKGTLEDSEGQLVDFKNTIILLTSNLGSEAIVDSVRKHGRGVDIAALVSEVADANQPLAVNKQQSITVSATPNLTTACDADRIREAIDNLISNAIKYSPIGGKISVQVGQEQNKNVIRIVDEGAGLSPEDIGRLFGRFQRLTAKPTAGESSTGLGLSIVKRIIDMHGGEVTAHSAGPGQGSTFTITLPAADA